jgi:hypothetical protein
LIDYVVDRLFNQGPMPVLEQELAFTDARQQVIADNIANVRRRISAEGSVG